MKSGTCTLFTPVTTGSISAVMFSAGTCTTTRPREALLKVPNTAIAIGARKSGTGRNSAGRRPPTSGRTNKSASAMPGGPPVYRDHRSWSPRAVPVSLAALPFWCCPRDGALNGTFPRWRLCLSASSLFSRLRSCFRLVGHNDAGETLAVAEAADHLRLMVTADVVGVDVAVGTDR